jgi:hypothetical protein
VVPELLAVYERALTDPPSRALPAAWQQLELDAPLIG